MSHGLSGGRAELSLVTLSSKSHLSFLHCYCLIMLLYFIHLFISATFELHYAFVLFCCLVSGSHHSGSPLARGARYCMSTDSSKVYTIPQTSSSGPEPEPEPEPEPGPVPGSEACGQTRPQPGCMKTTDVDDEDDPHNTEGPPNISECG